MARARVGPIPGKRHLQQQCERGLDCLFPAAHPRQTCVSTLKTGRGLGLVVVGNTSIGPPVEILVFIAKLAELEVG